MSDTLTHMRTNATVIRNVLLAKLNVSETVKVDLNEFKHVYIADHSGVLGKLIAYVVLSELLKMNSDVVEQTHSSVCCGVIDDTITTSEVFHHCAVTGIELNNSAINLIHYFCKTKIFLEDQNVDLDYGIFDLSTKLEFFKHIKRIREENGGSLKTITVLPKAISDVKDIMSFFKFMNDLPGELTDNTLLIKTNVDEAGMMNLDIFLFREQPTVHESNVSMDSSVSTGPELQSPSTEKI